MRIRASGCGRKQLLHFETEDVFQENLFIFLGKGTGHANRVETLSTPPLLRSSNLKCSEQTFSSLGDRELLSFVSTNGIVALFSLTDER